MPEEGSSSSRTTGSWASTQPRSTMRRDPVDSSEMNLSRKATRPISSRSSSTRRRIRRSVRTTHGMPSPVETASCARTWRSKARARVSKTVSDGKRRASWKERPSPARDRSAGAMPLMSRPPRCSCPRASGAKPQMASNTVVLPAPFGPIRPRIEPGATSNETLSTARTPP